MKFIIGQDAPAPTVNAWLEENKGGFNVMMRATDGKVQTVADFTVDPLSGMQINVHRVHDAALCEALGIGAKNVGALAVPVNTGISYQAPPPARYAPQASPAATKLPVEPWKGVDTPNTGE